MSAQAAGAAEPAPASGGRPAYALVLALVLLVSAALLVLPGMLLGFGVQAAGAAAGWWVGDPTSNDGEETWATGLGAVGCLAVLAGAVAVALGTRRRFGVRSAAPALVGVGALAVAGAVILVLLFA